MSLGLGAYYIHHINAKEVLDPSKNISAGYLPFDTDSTGTSTPTSNSMTVRSEPCACQISSTGIYAGLRFRFGSGPSKTGCTTCDKYALVVTAKDKFTGETLPNTDVAVKNVAGEIVYSGTTNNFGVVAFNDIVPDNYSIEGILYEIDLSASNATKDEFKPNIPLQKQILYEDTNFILKGKSVVCNSTIPLKDVSVVLKNQASAEQKSTMTDINGQFIFHVKQRASYEIYGKRENYISQTEHVSTNEYDRNATLFIKLEICMEKVDCENSLVLKNVHYDLDSYVIKESAKPELNRLAQFMRDNPGVRIELRSHTDCRGSDSYNLTLSQNRANAAVDYLTTQGIDRYRLTPIGFGETRLLNECDDGVPCSEEKHQVNRRTEMKVVCPGKE
ncbi:MAG: OmpA family protein [Saprospiraceae bacterium]